MDALVLFEFDTGPKTLVVSRLLPTRCSFAGGEYAIVGCRYVEMEMGKTKRDVHRYATWCVSHTTFRNNFFRSTRDFAGRPSPLRKRTNATQACTSASDCRLLDTSFRPARHVKQIEESISNFSR